MIIHYVNAQCFMILKVSEKHIALKIVKSALKCIYCICLKKKKDSVHNFRFD